jgi:hypothetical protein
VILHSRADDVVPFADSEELVRNSGLAASALVEVGSDHRLADPEPLMKMLEACEASAMRECAKNDSAQDRPDILSREGQYQPLCGDVNAWSWSKSWSTTWKCSPLHTVPYPHHGTI